MPLTNHSKSLTTYLLITAIILCLVTGCVFLSAADVIPLPVIPVMPVMLVSADTVTKTVDITYTPSYNTSYSLSLPSSLTINGDGSATTLTVGLSSWSDFPSNRSLYCNLDSVSALTSGDNSIDMIVKDADDNELTAGDLIGTFTPTSLSSTTQTDVAVITVGVGEKPADGGTYTGTIGFEVGLE